MRKGDSRKRRYVICKRKHETMREFKSTECCEELERPWKREGNYLNTRNFLTALFFVFFVLEFCNHHFIRCDRTNQINLRSRF